MTRPISTTTRGMMVMSAVLMMSPCFLPRSERRWAVVPVLLGAVGLMASLLTETSSPGEYEQSFTPSRELSEAVADPDVARTPRLGAHVE